MKLYLGSPRGQRHRGKDAKKWRLVEPFLSPQEVVSEHLIALDRGVKWGYRQWATAHRLAVKGGNAEAVQLCWAWLRTNATPTQLVRCREIAELTLATLPTPASYVLGTSPSLLAAFIKRRKWGDIKMLLRRRDLKMRRAANPLPPCIFSICATFGTPSIALLLGFEYHQRCLSAAFTNGNVKMALYLKSQASHFPAGVLGRRCFDSRRAILSGTCEIFLRWAREMRTAPPTSQRQLINFDPQTATELLRLLDIYDWLAPVVVFREILGTAPGGRVAALNVVGKFLLTKADKYLPLSARELASNDIIGLVASLASVETLKLIRSLGATDPFAAVQRLEHAALCSSQRAALVYAWTWLLETPRFWRNPDFIEDFARREGVGVRYLRQLYARLCGGADFDDGNCFHRLALAVWYLFQRQSFPLSVLNNPDSIDIEPLLLAACIASNEAHKPGVFRSDFRYLLSRAEYDYAGLVNFAARHSKKGVRVTKILAALPMRYRSE